MFLLLGYGPARIVVTVCECARCSSAGRMGYETIIGFRGRNFKGFLALKGNIIGFVIGFGYQERAKQQRDHEPSYCPRIASRRIITSPKQTTPSPRCGNWGDDNPWLLCLRGPNAV